MAWLKYTLDPQLGTWILFPEITGSAEKNPPMELVLRDGGMKQWEKNKEISNKKMKLIHWQMGAM